MRAPSLRGWAGALALLVLLGAPGHGQERADGGPAQGRPEGFPQRPELPDDLGELDSFEEFERWITLRDEAASPPPLLRLQLGPVFWVDIQSEIRADRRGLRGTPLRELERRQGLIASGVSPWVELSIGRDIRGGADVLHLVREGKLYHQDEPVLFDGVDLARPGDLVRSRFELFTASGFVEWDPLYGRTYRFGLLGGARYFRFQGAFEAVRRGLDPATLTVRRRGELISPFFGGFVELTPFEYLTVSSRVQFMNWSWKDVGLKSARYLEFRLGATIHIIPEVLGFGAEFRYLVVRAESSRDADRQLEAGTAASGVALTVTLTF
ncbi:MAG: hypothetical protein M9894_25065 [Planctomycetes bacterium]|nr:hypothetical protein [Planctomycetota bacterium]